MWGRTLVRKVSERMGGSISTAVPSLTRVWLTAARGVSELLPEVGWGKGEPPQLIHKAQPIRP